MDSSLETLIDQALAPLSGEVGADLTQTSSAELIQIRNQFGDASKDFAKLLDVGAEILSNQSKDLWALWALTGGILWSKRFEPADAFVGSLKTVSGFCERYWTNGYPNNPGLRNTILTNINKWWNTYLVRSGQETRVEQLREAHQYLAKLDEMLKSVTEGVDDREKSQKLPVLMSLGQVLKSLKILAKPDAAGGNSSTTTTDPTTNGSAPTVEAKPAPVAATPAAPPQPPTIAEGLEAAFDKAIKMLDAGNKEPALLDFQKVVEHQGEFANRFRASVMLGELYLKAGLPTHAKRVLDFANTQINEIRLPEWEPKLCSRLWRNLMKAHQSVSSEKPDNKLMADLFAKLCRIDPGAAANVEPIVEK